MRQRCTTREMGSRKIERGMYLATVSESTTSTRSLRPPRQCIPLHARYSELPGTSPTSTCTLVACSKQRKSDELRQPPPAFGSVAIAVACESSQAIPASQAAMVDGRKSLLIGGRDSYLTGGLVRELEHVMPGHVAFRRIPDVDSVSDMRCDWFQHLASRHRTVRSTISIVEAPV